jgi:hypothetical protein
MKTYYWFNQNRLMSHLRTGFCALVILGASLTLPGAEAGGPPLPLSGGFFPCFTFADQRQVDENLIITFNVSTVATWDLTGCLEGTEVDVVHHDGSITLRGIGTFTGSVNGSPSGTLQFRYEGIGNINTGHENLHFVGRRGTGGLAGIYVQGTAEGDLGGACNNCDGDNGHFGGHGTYNGQILFAP